MAIRVANLSQPLTDRPDRSAGYLDEPVSIKNPERLTEWPRTSEGSDLLHVIGQIKGKAGRGPELPSLLQKLSNAALGVLGYVKS